VGQQRRAELAAESLREVHDFSTEVLLSTKGSSSAPGESAAVHHAQTSLAAFGDGARKGNHEPAVVRTVESLTVAERDASAHAQEEKTRTVGGIPSR
jgi:hypothetical protein